MTITRDQARRFLLLRHNLLPPRSLTGTEGILSFLRRVRSIQFDPLDRVGTNPLLVLQSRIAGFRPEQLRDLLYGQRLLLEGFDKMLSIYHREDFPSFARERAAAGQRFGAPGSPVMEVLPQVRAELENRGPLCSADLGLTQRVDWPWAPTRIGRAALESMYFRGELVIHRRQKRRKFYDLAERHLPRQLLEAPDPFADEEEYLAWRVQRRIAGIGLVPDRGGDAWLGIRGLKNGVRRQILDRLVAAGTVKAVEIESSPLSWYLPAEEQPLLDAAAESGRQEQSEAAFIAPLDNLLWDRHMIEELFGFRYRWEVYKPAAEREYGYYVLPVLYGDRFIARFEPRRNRKMQQLCIDGFWWEESIEPTTPMYAALQRALCAFRDYVGMKEITLTGQAAQSGVGDILPA